MFHFGEWMQNTDIIKIRTKAILDFLINHPDYQLSSREWLVFLTVAMEEGLTSPQLVEHLQLPQQTLSRKIRNLGQSVNAAGETEGYNLIKAIRKGKALSYFLTDAGKGLWHDFSGMHAKVDKLVVKESKKGGS